MDKFNLSPSFQMIEKRFVEPFETPPTAWNFFVRV
jgi:hypothetical protein